MEFIRRLFRTWRRTTRDDGVSPLVAENLAALKARQTQCLRLEAGGDGPSQLGGVPAISGAWPRYEGRPLSCVAQLDLKQVREAGGPEWLPDHGRLIFFHGLEFGSWGNDPGDVGTAIVIHETGSTATVAEPGDLSEEAKFPPYPVVFRSDKSFPSGQRMPIDWRRLNTASVDALEAALLELSPPAPAHQIGGYPGPVQYDGMEAECQAIAQRLGRQDGEASDWRLLLQLDSDADADMMWVDVGSLYFWIREQDARAGDFSKVWRILQSN